MIAAGLADLLGKYTCLCDWKLASIINSEHYCGRIVELMESSVDDVMKVAHKAKDRDPEVLGSIMEGLVLAGVAMSLYGNSRPGSGCEHHLSHYWEMVFEQAGKRPAPHGVQVGVGTVLILKLVEALRNTKVDFDAARAYAKAYDQAAWEENIRKAYGPAAQGVIEMEAKAQKNEINAHLKRIDVMEAQWGELMDALEALPSSEKMEELLKSLDSSWLPGQIEVDADMLRNTLRYGKEVRARYTILQMIWDLGLLEKLSDQVIEEVCG